MTGDRSVLNQAHFAEGAVFEGMGPTDLRNVYIPLDPEMYLTARQEEEELEEPRFQYARLVDATRLDISRSVHEFARHFSPPCMRHWHGLELRFRYLAGTIDITIRSSRSTTSGKGNMLTGYSNSD